MINRRIYLGSEPNENISEILPVYKITQFVADVKNDERLAEQVAFGSGYGNPMTTGGLLGFKGWLANANCTGLDGADDEDKVGLTRFLGKLVLLGEKMTDTKRLFEFAQLAEASYADFTNFNVS